MHNTLAVAVVKSLEQLVDVVTHIDVVELRVEASKVRVIHIFEDERRGLALRGGK